MIPPRLGVLLSATVVCLLLAGTALAGPWIAPDWAGNEPTYPPGSLYFHTNVYRTSPVLFRTVLDAGESIRWAGFQARGSGFMYVFLNGRQIAALAGRGDAAVAWPIEVELTHLLRPGKNVLVISTKADGFALDGAIAPENGQFQHFGTDSQRWRVQKLAPLTIVEQDPLIRPDFNDAKWFAVKADNGKALAASDQTLRGICDRLSRQRLAKWDEDAAWRMQMLGRKGIAVMDWEAHGFGGAGRLPNWISAGASAALSMPPTPGFAHNRAEALCRFVVLSDEAANLENHATGLAALNATAADVEACKIASAKMRPLLARMEESIRKGDDAAALIDAAALQAIADAASKGRILNRLNRALDNKFSWFDTTAMLESDPAQWGISLSPAPEVFANPLSPAALVTAREIELTLEGWDKLQPMRVYNKPPNVGPVCLWAVLDGKVRSLKPGAGDLVYDRATHGNLSENWVLIAHDMSRGGNLPIELVFLQPPTRITFKPGQNGASAVTVAFEKTGSQLFMLRPLKEWRGFLQEARTLADSPLNERDAARYIETCRLWSRALLEYPVSFSESFVRDPQDKNALIVADVYNYRRLTDAWATKPLRLAPLPPLATYGLMMGYPGLRVISEARTLGSRGIWGDEIAALDTDHIVYRIPLDPIKRFGGFTSYCFGPTDIGQPGSLTEIKTIKSTGSNTFRPQHNQTGEPAMKTTRWCLQEGIQNVFNIDEKWIPDAVEHYRRLAEQCRDFPPDAIAYDLLNEPETRQPRAYAALMKKITAAIRALDKTHLIYVEAMPAWGPGAKPFPQGAFETLEPTGDPLTVYSFHDYDYRLPPRWPNDTGDVRDILTRWIPAFRFSIDHRCPIHLGEFGGFEQTKQSVYDNPCALTVMMDYLNTFDQFGWHWHYYANRGITRVRQDGSLQESYVQEAYRRYFARGTFNVNRGK